MIEPVYQLTSPITTIKGIGPSVYFKLSKKGIETVADLLQLFPIRYADYSKVGKIGSLINEETVTLKVKVVRLKNQITRKRSFTIQTMAVKDSTGEIEVTWFNQPFILKVFTVGEEYSLSGQVAEFKNKLTFQVSEYEPVAKKGVNTGRIIPYYSETVGQSSKFIRQKVWEVLSHLDGSSFNDDYVSKHTQRKLLPLKDTLQQIHFPSSQTALEAAKERLRYEQLTQIKLQQLKVRRRLAKQPFPRLNKLPEDPVKNSFVNSLPFTLTRSQNTTMASLYQSLKNGQYLNRLLMGDVGSGKTVVMAYLSWLMFLNHQKVLILVPTEVLGQQHYQSFQQLFSQTGASIKLLTAKHKAAEITKADILIGTHSLLFQKENLECGLLIVDEQHKFGVKQRDYLLKQTALYPHLLTVSATPIPRSLALTMYGEMDVDYLAEKPYSAKVKTFLVPEHKREASYGWLEKQIKQNKVQVYVICPAVEKNESRSLELKTIKEEEIKLKKLFPHLKIAAIYSQHPDKLNLINDFRSGRYDILISTSLIEVGLDIGNANIMLIENAERFGLSQLHQFRGRIGRREAEAYCLLFTTAKDGPALTRLKVLETTSDPLTIATMDLELRGPGNILGIEQHGLGYLTFATLMDQALLNSVESTAKLILDNYPKIAYTSFLVKNIKHN